MLFALILVRLAPLTAGNVVLIEGTPEPLVTKTPLLEENMKPVVLAAV